MPASAASVERITAGEAFTMFSDGPARRAAAVLLDAPTRLVTDLAGAPAGGEAVTGKAGSRLVFGLTLPVPMTSGSIEPGGHGLTFHLASTGAAEVALRPATPGLSPVAPAQAMAARPSPPHNVRMAVPAAKRRLPLPPVAGDPDRPLVVIDAGHGGHDPGAIGPEGHREKDITLALAQAIRAKLLKSGRARVALTRADDRFLVLQERYGIARKLGASLFISIHCDSAGVPGASGASIYTLSEIASDKEAARLAARENKADIIAGVNLDDTSADISSILIDLTQRETMNASAAFAQLLGREAKPLLPFKPQFHRMASLMVLKAPDLPSVLFETGYISNPEDARRLASPDGQDAVAEGVRRAVEVHFAKALASR